MKDSTEKLTIEWLEQFDGSDDVWHFDTGWYGVGTPDEEDSDATHEGTVSEVIADLQANQEAAQE